MFDLDKWREIFHSLARHKLRTLLTAFGVFWGIFLLVLLLGVGKGLENGVYAQFNRSAVNRFAIWGRSTRVAYRGLNPGREIRLTPDDVEAVRTGIPEVRYINASVGLWGGGTISYKNVTGAFFVRGELPDLLHVRYFTIAKGRFLNEQDVVGGRKVAVIGKQVEQILFKHEDPIGKYISIKGVFFQVVGVFDVAGIGSNRRETEWIYIPLPTLLQTFHQGGHIWSMNVVVDKSVSVAEVESKTVDLLKRRHRIAPDDEKALGSWNAGEEFGKLQALFQGIRIFLWAIGIGTIFSGIIGVSNIMLIIVKERTREFGIRKAIGATPFSIISLILQEAVFLTMISGYLGLAVSVGLLEALSFLMRKFEIQNEFFSDPEVEFSLAIGAIIILVLAGAIAGLIPARSAVRINPIEALGSE
ncbi:MAG: ABC transporter permease [bacterium]|nr:ABC transporter permease [bacterium]